MHKVLVLAVIYVNTVQLPQLWNGSLCHINGQQPTLCPDEHGDTEALEIQVKTHNRNISIQAVLTDLSSRRPSPLLWPFSSKGNDNMALASGPWVSGTLTGRSSGTRAPAELAKGGNALSFEDSCVCERDQAQAGKGHLQQAQ